MLKTSSMVLIKHTFANRLVYAGLHFVLSQLQCWVARL